LIPERKTSGGAAGLSFCAWKVCVEIRRLRWLKTIEWE
jgi:hypothetical protein